MALPLPRTDLHLRWSWETWEDTFLCLLARGSISTTWDFLERRPEDTLTPMHSEEAGAGKGGCILGHNQTMLRVEKLITQNQTVDKGRSFLLWNGHIFRKLKLLPVFWSSLILKGLKNLVVRANRTPPFWVIWENASHILLISPLQPIVETRYTPKSLHGAFYLLLNWQILSHLFWTPSWKKNISVCGERGRRK